jgi:hypothetical protein
MSNSVKNLLSVAGIALGWLFWSWAVGPYFATGITVIMFLVNLYIAWATRSTQQTIAAFLDDINRTH